MVDVAVVCYVEQLLWYIDSVFAAGRVYRPCKKQCSCYQLNVKVVGSHAIFTVGEDGATHQF